jgi:hypothetical protein
MLQGTFTHPTTQQQTPDAYLVLDDVVVSLQGQYAAIHWSVYASKAAYTALVNNTAVVTPVYSSHNEALAPNFSQVQLGALNAGSLDAQIRQAGYQWLQTLPQFSTWSIVS